MIVNSYIFVGILTD